jgi:hypothetical protein
LRCLGWTKKLARLPIFGPSCGALSLVLGQIFGQPKNHNLSNVLHYPLVCFIPFFVCFKASEAITWWLELIFDSLRRPIVGGGGCLESSQRTGMGDGSSSAERASICAGRQVSAVPTGSRSVHASFRPPIPALSQADPKIKLPKPLFVPISHISTLCNPKSKSATP